MIAVSFRYDNPRIHYEKDYAATGTMPGDVRIVMDRTPAEPRPKELKTVSEIFGGRAMNRAERRAAKSKRR